jgi:ribose transport system ATP-binding protein
MGTAESKILGEQHPETLLSLHGVQKSFDSNLVLKNINFSVNKGEIHALVGENGAGKSTCLGLLYGLQAPSSGEIKRDGNAVRILGPSHAQDIGIGCVFQELSLAGSLSIAENIFAGRAPSRFGVVDWKELNHRATALLKEFGLSLDVTALVDSPAISTRQIVEIAKALSLDSKVLLLDEPTSALTPDEVQALFTVLRTLTARGIGIVYLSHHMSEIFAISDRISVLRDGHMISSLPTQDTNQEKVVAEMIGSAHPGNVERTTDALGDVMLEIHNLSQDGQFFDISFQLRKGEILGLAGLLGSRRSEIMRCIAGLTQPDSGNITLDKQPVQFPSLRAAMQAGVGFVPEERKTEGLFLNDPLDANLVSSSMEKHTSFGLLNALSIKKGSENAIAAFSVKTRGHREKIGALSDGNQQKVMLAKWLERAPNLSVVRVFGTNGGLN